MTPEGKVKAQIRKVLDRYGVYYFMPVQSGLGAAGLDFHCVIAYQRIPVAFFVEAKPEGGKPTKRQELLIDRLRRYQNARTFIVNDDIELEILENWLKGIKI